MDTLTKGDIVTVPGRLLSPDYRAIVTDVAEGEGVVRVMSIASLNSRWVRAQDCLKEV